MKCSCRCYPYITTEYKDFTYECDQAEETGWSWARSDTSDISGVARKIDRVSEHKQNRGCLNNVVDQFVGRAV